MAYAAKLCNPTQWECVLPYEKGIVLRIPAFGEVTLEMNQMLDFRRDQPGSEAVLEVTDYFGLFLFDADRPYDNQALEAITLSHRKKNDQYKNAVQRMRDMRAASGVNPDEDAFEETLNQMGLVTLRGQVKALASQISKYKAVVGDGDRNVRAQFDPDRTIFVLDPPREFPSVAAKDFFLEQNPTVAVEHKGWLARVESVAVEPVEATVSE